MKLITHDGVKGRTFPQPSAATVQAALYAMAGNESAFCILQNDDYNSVQAAWTEGGYHLEYIEQDPSDFEVSLPRQDAAVACHWFWSLLQGIRLPEWSE